jgi:3'-phosphoadenosine 5'-phosphosulfate sulfotransferase (PAPS reductase)/FAD synthetase
MECKNHVVSFSGGRTSAYMVWLFEQRRKVENINVEYLFCDTGAEHPKTYEFILEVVKQWNIDLTCLRTVVSPEAGVGVSYQVIPLNDCTDDLKPFKAICEKYGTPYNPSGGHCTDFMKTIPAEKYANDKYGKLNYTKWLGMRVDEPKRIKTVNAQLELFEKKQNKKNVNVDYLAHISDFEKSDILDWWSKQSFNLDLDSDILGNCQFCIKRGINKVALSARYEPEAAKRFIKMIESDTIPMFHANREMRKEIMYRGNYSLSGIIELYKDFTVEDIRKTMRDYIESDSETCSSSCEATVSNYDLFDL